MPTYLNSVDKNNRDIIFIDFISFVLILNVYRLQLERDGGPRGPDVLVGCLAQVAAVRCIKCNYGNHVFIYLTGYQRLVEF